MTRSSDTPHPGKKRYLMSVVGASEKLEQVIWARNKKEAYAAWLRRFETIDFIEDQEGYVQITAERLLTEQELAARERTAIVAEALDEGGD